eukprot:5108447-Pleurochrysis_carterae.AAC.1
MAEKVAEEGVPLGSNTTNSLAGTGGNFEKMRAPIDGAVGNMPRCAMLSQDTFEVFINCHFSLWALEGPGGVVVSTDNPSV